MTGPDKIWINWTPTDDESHPSMVAAAVLPKYLKHIDYPVEYHRTAAHPVTVELLVQWEAQLLGGYVKETSVALQIRAAIAQMEK